MCKMWVNLLHMMKHCFIHFLGWTLRTLNLETQFLSPTNINYCRHCSHDIFYLHHQLDGSLHMWSWFRLSKMSSYGHSGWFLVQKVWLWCKLSGRRCLSSLIEVDKTFTSVQKLGFLISMPLHFHVLVKEEQTEEHCLLMCESEWSKSEDIFETHSFKYCCFE